MINPFDRARIRAVTGCADKTIKKYPDVSDASKRRIESGAKVAGVALGGGPSVAGTVAAEVVAIASAPPAA